MRFNLQRMSDSRNDRFTRLVSESRTALRRYVLRFVRSHEVADEIVQEAFLRTYESGDKVVTPRAFLFSTARNLAFNAHRDQRNAKTDSVGNFDELRVVTQDAALDEALLAEEQTRLIKEAVDGLPPQCRAAFTLRVFQECSYKEIAHQLSISTKTVEKYITRGLRETHELLKRTYMDAGDGPRLASYGPCMTLHPTSHSGRTRYRC